jgi:hypothetical protein
MTIGLLLFPLIVQAQVLNNVSLRVVLIETTTLSGTGFTVDVDGRQYLITAKHVASGLKDGDSVRIHRVDGWMKTKVKVFRCDEPIDIAVLIPDRQLTVNFALEPSIAGMQVGQDTYFLGFPYGWLLSDNKYHSVSVSFPFIKKATASASAPAGSHAVLYLDGHNNPGFSGGPIVFRDFNQAGYIMKVAGVISGYRPNLQPVLIKKRLDANEDVSHIEPWRIVTINGQRFKLEDGEQLVDTNSGIIQGYTIDAAVDLIKKHPDGPMAKDGNPPLE